MQRIIRLWGRLRSAQGQTMAEYGALITVIAVVVVAAAIMLGPDVSSLFSSSSARV
jgi:Flp pilus assembly pilin Flp